MGSIVIDNKSFVLDIETNCFIESITLRGDSSLIIRTKNELQCPKLVIGTLVIEGEGTNRIEGFASVEALISHTTGALYTEHLVIENSVEFSVLPESFEGFLGIKAKDVVLYDTSCSFLEKQAVQFGVTPESLQPVLDAFFTPIGRSIVDSNIFCSCYGVDNDRSIFIDSICKRVILSSFEVSSIIETCKDGLQINLTGSHTSNMSTLMKNIESIFVGGVRYYIVKESSDLLRVTDKFLTSKANLLLNSGYTQFNAYDFIDATIRTRFLLDAYVDGRVSDEMSAYQALILNQGVALLSIDFDAQGFQRYSGSLINSSNYELSEGVYSFKESGTATEITLEGSFNKIIWGTDADEVSVKIDGNVLKSTISSIGVMESGTRKVEVFQATFGSEMAFYFRGNENQFIPDLTSEEDFEEFRDVWNSIVSSLNKESIVYVLLGKGMRYVPSSMFEGFTGLKRVLIEDSFIKYLLNENHSISVGDRAFYGCSSLTRIAPRFYEGMYPYSYTRELGGLYKRFDKYVESLLLGDIGNEAFYGCSELEISISPASLGDSALEGVKRVNVNFMATEAKDFILGNRALANVKRVDSLSYDLNIDGIPDDMVPQKGDYTQFNQIPCRNLVLGEECVAGSEVVNFAAIYSQGMTLGDRAFYSISRYLRFYSTGGSAGNRVIFGNECFANCRNAVVYEEGSVVNNLPVTLGDGVFDDSAPIARDWVLTEGSEIVGSLFGSNKRANLDFLVLKGAVNASLDVLSEVAVVASLTDSVGTLVPNAQLVETEYGAYTLSKDGQDEVINALYGDYDFSKPVKVVSEQGYSFYSKGRSKVTINQDGKNILNTSGLSLDPINSTVIGSGTALYEVYMTALSEEYDIYQNLNKTKPLVSAAKFALYSGIVPVIGFLDGVGTIVDWKGHYGSVFRREIEGGVLLVAVDPICFEDYNGAIIRDTRLLDAETFAADSDVVLNEDGVIFFSGDDILSIDENGVLESTASVEEMSIGSETELIDVISSDRRYLEARVLRASTGYVTGNCYLEIDPVTGTIYLSPLEGHEDDEEFYMDDYEGSFINGIWQSTAPWFSELELLNTGVFLNLQQILLTGKRFTVGAYSFPQVEVLNTDGGFAQFTEGLTVNEGAFVGSTFANLEMSKLTSNRGFTQCSFGSLLLDSPELLSNGAFEDCYVANSVVIQNSGDFLADNTVFSGMIVDGDVSIEQSESAEFNSFLNGSVEGITVNGVLSMVVRSCSWGVVNSQIKSANVTVVQNANTELGSGLFNGTEFGGLTISYKGVWTDDRVEGGSWFDGASVNGSVIVNFVDDTVTPVNWFSGISCLNTITFNNAKTLYPGVLSNVVSGRVNIGNPDRVLSQALYGLDCDILSCSREVSFDEVSDDAFITTTPGVAKGFKLNESFYNLTLATGYTWEDLSFNISFGPKRVISIYYGGQEILEVYKGVLKI